jgi:hypothetical protein
MTDSTRNLDGLTSLGSFAGFTIPARARFVGQFLGHAIFSSLTVGLVAGQTGAAVLSCGPLVPFLCGSWAGYTWGCLGFWKQSRAKALDCARRYPKVMAHGLTFLCPAKHSPPPVETTQGSATELRDKNEGKVLEEWIFAGGIGRISYAILAAQSCEEDIFEMQRKKRQELIDGYGASST